MSTSKPSIGPARDSDLDQLVALDARAFSQVDRYRRREWAGLLSESLRGGPATILVARSTSEAILGAVVVAGDAEALDVTIVSLAVDSHYRRTGLGRRLLCTAVAQQPAEFRTVSLEVRTANAGARALYEQLGFQVVRRMRKYYADGAAALEYRAALHTVLDACQLAGYPRSCGSG